MTKKSQSQDEDEEAMMTERRRRGPKNMFNLSNDEYYMPKQGKELQPQQRRILHAETR